MENEPKWTPGPWGMIQHGERDSRVGANTLLAIVYSTAFRDTENQRANAHLIAAAPELYKALEEARKTLMECAEDTIGTPSSAVFRIQAEQCAAVLAKARGEK